MLARFGTRPPMFLLTRGSRFGEFPRYAKTQLMNLAYLCVLAAAVIPYFCVGYAKSTSHYVKEGNRAPRSYAEGLSGSRKRAYWAHQNGFEAFPPFAAAVIMATLAGVEQSTIDTLALTFVISRLAYSAFYIVDRARLRSVVWAVGIGSTGLLFVLGATA